jgi:hypothetical protein
MVEAGRRQHYPRESQEDQGRHGALNAAIAVMSPAHMEIYTAASALASSTRPPALSGTALDLVTRAVPRSEQLRTFRVFLAKHQSLPVEEDVRWLLTHSNQISTIVAAMQAAQRHDISFELQLRSQTPAR